MLKKMLMKEYKELKETYQIMLQEKNNIQFDQAEFLEKISLMLGIVKRSNDGRIIGGGITLREQRSNIIEGIANLKRDFFNKQETSDVIDLRNKEIQNKLWGLMEIALTGEREIKKIENDNNN